MVTNLASYDKVGCISNYYEVIILKLGGDGLMRTLILAVVGILAFYLFISLFGMFCEPSVDPEIEKQLEREFHERRSREIMEDWW